MDLIPVANSCVQMCQLIHREDIYQVKESVSHIRVGVILKYMDICACLSVEKIAKASCVTASMDHLRLSDEFNVFPGEVIVIEAQVVRCFNKSAEVIVRVLLDSSLTTSNFSPSTNQTKQSTPQQSTVCIAHGFFIFVRLDKQIMPSVFPQTFTESQEYELSMERRKYRQSKKDLIEKNPTILQLQQVSYNYLSNESVLADQSLLQYTYIVLPTHANHMGNTFGGQLLEWAEEIAILSARKHVNSAIRSQFTLQFIPTSTEVSTHSLLPSNNFLFNTLYVHEMSFLAPSTIGDRITCHAQGCRTYGSVIEIEVIITANNVEQNQFRHINTGYFLISCRDDYNREVIIPPLRPVTYEQKLRYENSLKRMILVTIRSESRLNQLEVPFSLQEYSIEPSSPSTLKSNLMVQIYESSIWNTSNTSSSSSTTSTATATTTPSSNQNPLYSTNFNDIDLVLVQEYALQDVIGLLCALSSRDLPSTPLLPQSPSPSTTSSKLVSMHDIENRWELLYSNQITPASPSPVASTASEGNKRGNLFEMRLCRGGNTSSAHQQGDGSGRDLNTADNLNSRITKLKITLILHEKLSVIANYLLDFTHRSEWDDILSGEVKKKIIENQIDIVRMKSNENKKLHIDYCLLRCHRQLDDGRYAIVSRSILHPSVPPVEGCIRGEVLPSGYLLTPIHSKDYLKDVNREETGENDWTLVQYILQLDTLTSRQLSGEMDGTSKEILSSMKRLERLFNK